MRKTPYLPSNEITQAYNDGVVRIYTLTDAARAGIYAAAAGDAENNAALRRTASRSPAILPE